MRIRRIHLTEVEVPARPDSINSPEGPGLGVELDRDAVQRYKTNELEIQ